AFEKRTRGEAILCGREGLQPAGVTLQAGRLYRTRQVQMIVTLMTRRQVPSRFGGVIRDGRLIQEAVDGKKVATANRPGSDEVLEWPRPVNRGSGVGKVVTEEPPIPVAVDTIANAGKRV